MNSRHNVAYSSLMQLPDGRIGLFYEGRNYKMIELVRLELNWLLDE